MSKFVALLASGLAQGAIVTLAAVGFLLIYKATGIVNFAQGDLITLGAYLAIWATLDLGFDLVPAYVFTVVFMFVVGVVFERLAYAPAARALRPRGRDRDAGRATHPPFHHRPLAGHGPQFLESPVEAEVVEILGDNVV